MARMLAVGAALVVAAVGVVGGAGVAAQLATPAPFPVAPDPAECRVAPRPIAEVVAVVATPTTVDAGGAASPAPFLPPAEEAVDDATAEAVAATLRELFACTNASDFLRVYALFTDDFVRDFFAGTPMTPEVEAVLSAPPRPLPDDQRRVIVRLGEPRLLPDGRVGVPIVLDEPDDPRAEEPDCAILARAGDRWLVDEIHEDVPPAATPAAG